MHLVLRANVIFPAAALKEFWTEWKYCITGPLMWEELVKNSFLYFKWSTLLHPVRLKEEKGNQILIQIIWWASADNVGRSSAGAMSDPDYPSPRWLIKLPCGLLKKLVCRKTLHTYFREYFLIFLGVLCFFKYIVLIDKTQVW